MESTYHGGGRIRCLCVWRRRELGGLLRFLCVGGGAGDVVEVELLLLLDFFVCLLFYDT